MRLLTVKNLRKTFAQEKEAIHAVNGVSFHVDKGEIYGLIGLSGAGKSTLIRCLNLLERPDSGEICSTELILQHKVKPSCAKSGVKWA